MTDSQPTEQRDASANPATTPYHASTTAVQRLGLLPSALLALVACHLPLVSLLRLQRCSRALTGLRADDSYTGVAWAHAKLNVDTDSKLSEWTLPISQCVSGQQRSIPVGVWQAALPGFRAVIARRMEDSRDERREQAQQLSKWVSGEQPTQWMLARRDDKGRLCEVADVPQAQSELGAERVEVLRDIHWSDINSSCVQRDVEVRCRLVLQACPYLQHLGLAIDTVVHVEPSHEDTFALVPRLRSLDLVQRDSGHQAPELLIDEPPIDFERMLDSLPHLTSLRCYDVYLGVSDLLDIAAHSTLTELFIKAEGKQLADAEWIGSEISFPIGADEDKRQLELTAGSIVFDGDVEAEEDNEVQAAHADRTESVASAPATVGGSEEQAPAWTSDEMQRMHTALTRTQPSRRGCKWRLLLAEWLHRRLRRGKLHIDKQQTKWLLRHYRRRVALLRSTLWQQLSELTVNTAAAAEEARTDQLELLQLQLQSRWVACFHAVKRLKSLRAQHRDN